MEVANLDIVARSDKAVQASAEVQAALAKTAAVADAVIGPIAGAYDRLKDKILSVRGSLLTLTAAFGVGSIIGQIEDFEKTMSAVKAVTEANGEQFDELTKKARELGATTTFSGQDAAEAMFKLGQAGFSVDKIMDSVGETLKLAQAGMLELDEAAQITAQTLNNFNLKADQTTRATDVLTKAANESATGVREIAEALKYVGPIAANTGQSLETTVAVIGTLANAGIDASMAGTSIRQMLLALASPTEQARKEIEALGLSLADINPETNNLIDILKKFAKAGIDAGQASTIFGDRAATAVLAVAGKVGDLEKMSKSLEHAQGTADKFANTLTDNLYGAIKELESAFQEMILQTGDSGLAGALKSLVVFTTNLINAFNGLLPATAEGAKMFYFLRDAIEVAAAAAAGWAAGRIVDAVVNYVAGIVKAISALRGMTAAQLALNAAMLANPITALATILGTVVGLYLVFRDKTRDATQAQTDLNAVLKDSDDALKTYKATITDTSAELEKMSQTKLRTSLLEVQTELARTQKEFDATKKSVLDWVAAGNIANETLTDYKAEFKELIPAFEQGKIGIDEFLAGLQKIGEGTGDAAKEAKVMAQGLLESRAAFNQQSDAVKTLQDRMKLIQDAIKGVKSEFMDLSEVQVTAKKTGEQHVQLTQEQKKAIADLIEDLKKQTAEFQLQAKGGAESALALNKVKAEATLAKAGISGLTPEVQKLLVALNAAQAAAARSELGRSLTEQIKALELQAEKGPEAALAIQKLHDTMELAKKGADGLGKQLEDLYDKLEKTQQVSDALDIAKQLNPAIGAAQEFTYATKALAEANKQGKMSGDELEKNLQLLYVRYRDVLDPLGKVNRDLDDQTYLLGLNARQREIETQVLQIYYQTLAQGHIMSDQEVKDLRDRLTAMQQLNDVVKEQDNLLANTVEKRKQFSDQLTAIQNLLANPTSGFTGADAATSTVDIVKQMGLDPSTLQAQSDAIIGQAKEMYAKIDELRKANLISEQEAAGLRLQVWAQSQAAQLKTADTFFTDLAQLSKSNNSKLAAIGKAAAISKAIIDTYTAATGAYAALASIPYVGPYLGAAAAAAAVAAGLANVAAIRSQPTGFKTGGEFMIGGSGGPDSQMVMFKGSPGEQVQVRTPEQVRKGDPGANQAAGDQGSGGNTNLRIVNVMDPKMVGDFLSTPEGEQVFVNTMRRNADAVRSVVGQN